MKSALQLRLLPSWADNRKTGEVFRSDCDVAGGSEIGDDMPVLGGDPASPPLDSNLRTNTEETSEALIPAECLNHIQVTHHKREIRTLGLNVKRDFTVAQGSSLRTANSQAGQNVPSFSTMPVGRPAIRPEVRALMRHIGIRLRWVREAYGKSQQEMADIVGVSQTAWGKWELGQRTPDRYKVPEVVARLKISIEYLTGNSLDGVERNLAIRLAAAHPELVQPTHSRSDKGTDRT